MAYTEASGKASIKYAKKNLKRIPLDVKLEQYEQIKAFAEDHDESINGLIKRLLTEAGAIKNTMEE